MKRIKKSTAIIIAIVIVLSVVLPIGLFYLGGGNREVKLSSYKGLSINMEKYNAIGIAMSNKTTKTISNASFITTDSEGSELNDNNSEKVIVGQTEDEEIEEVVFQDVDGNIFEQDLYIVKTFIFNKITFIQTSKNIFASNNPAFFGASANESFYVIDNATGKIYELKNDVFDEFSTYLVVRKDTSTFTHEYNVTHQFCDWFESDTGVYMYFYGEIGQSAVDGALYKFQTTNGRLELMRINETAHRQVYDPYLFMYVDKYDNIYVNQQDINDNGKFPMRLLYGFLRKTNADKYKYTRLDAAPAGRGLDGRVYLQDAISYYDENGELQQAEQSVDTTFLGQVLLDERDDAKYYLLIFSTDECQDHWLKQSCRRYEIYKKTETTSKLIVSLDAYWATAGHLPRIENGTLYYLTGGATVNSNIVLSGCNIYTGECESLYSYSPGESFGMNLFDTFIKDGSTMMTLRFLSY